MCICLFEFECINTPTVVLVPASVPGVTPRHRARLHLCHLIQEERKWIAASHGKRIRTWEGGDYGDTPSHEDEPDDIVTPLCDLNRIIEVIM